MIYIYIYIYLIYNAVIYIYIIYIYIICIYIYKRVCTQDGSQYQYITGRENAHKAPKKLAIEKETVSPYIWHYAIPHYTFCYCKPTHYTLCVYI